MKAVIEKFNTSVFIFLFLAVSIVSSSVSSASAQTVTVSYTPIPFSNPDIISPGRGFEHWFNWFAFDNVNTVRVPAGNTQVPDMYARINWAQIENAGSGTTPANPRYNWSTFDMYLNNAITTGKKLNFGILPICEGYAPYGSPGGYDLSYPTYLHNQMQAESINSRDWASNQTGMWIPNWNSTNYLAALDALNAAIADHINTGSYNGVPYKNVVNIIDVRGYGHWGEWNNANYFNEYPAGRFPTAATLISIVNSHINRFPDNPLVAMTDGFSSTNSSSNPPQATYHLLTASNNWGPLGWRRDNWGQELQDEILIDNPGSWNGVAFAPLIMDKWKTSPITGEPNRGGTFIIDQAGVPYGYLPREVRRYHISSIGNGNFQTSDISTQRSKDSIIEASKWMGYRIYPESIVSTSAIERCTPFSIRTQWRNAGIAPTYEDWDITFELRTAGNVKVWSGVSSYSLRSLLPNTTAVSHEDMFSLPNSLASGTYNLVVIIKEKKNYRQPLPLAINGRAADGSYFVRTVVLGAAVANGTPVANAGADVTISATPGQATLSGGLSTDPEDGAMQYAWRKVSGPGNPLLVSAGSMNTLVTGLTINGVYVFELAVTDDHCITDLDSVRVTVVTSAANLLPYAFAGEDASTNTSIYQLDGRASYDPDGFITTYSWTKVSGPTGFLITGNTTSTPSVSALMLGTYEFELRVTDNTGAVSRDTIRLLSEASILPIRWQSLTAKRNNGNIVVQWSVTGTSGNDQYAVLRSTDGKEFELAGVVKGNSRGGMIQEFEFTEASQTLGDVFYRIQYTDAGGQKSYSVIVKVSAADPSTARLICYPNPVKDQLQIQLPLFTGSWVDVEVYNAEGKRFVQQRFFPATEKALITLSTEKWPAGTYFLKINQLNKSPWREKIIKQ